MSGIQVLSDIPKGGNKLDKTATPKGKDVSDSPENVAAVFAAMLSGLMNSNVDSKGQNSSIAGQESEEKQSAGKPGQSVLNPNEQASMLGYGNFALTNLFQPMLQSDLPAGKEANSGNVVSQGIGGLAVPNASVMIAPIVSGNNFELAMLNFPSQASDEVSAQSGMTTPKPGANPAITELDKYRQVITDLLVALSGEITDTTPKGTPLGSESARTKNLSQDLAKIVQGWMTGVDEAAKEGQASSGQVTKSVEIPKALQEGGATMSNSSLNKTFVSLEALSGPKVTHQDLAKIVEGWVTATDKATKNDYASSGNSSSTQVIDRAENTGVKDLRQDIAKIVEGWMSVTDTVTKDGQASSGKTGIQPLLDALNSGIGTGNAAFNAKAATLLADIDPFLRQGIADVKVPQGVNGTQDAEVSILDPVQQKSEGMGLQENKTSKIFQGTFREEVQKGDSRQSTEVSGVKDIKTQNINSGIGIASNQVATNVADGKTIAIPVWEQISTVVRQQIMDRGQALKELDIQLHPADLGKIQIGMRWENGQVHLVVQASEAATGQLLQNQLSDLRQSLTNQGVNCGMLQMGQGGDQRQNHRGDEHPRMLNHNLDLNEDEDPISIINPLSLGQEGTNRINVTA